MIWNVLVTSRTCVGVNITEPDLKPLVEAGRKTWAEFEPKLGKDLIQKISTAAAAAH